MQLAEWSQPSVSLDLCEIAESLIDKQSSRKVVQQSCSPRCFSLLS
jgi:hypothetical protein